MNNGVPQFLESRRSAGSHAALPRAAFALLALVFTLTGASRALAATASVGLGTAASFSVLGGSTVTNTGPTTMFGDLGLSPGSSVTGAPHVLGQAHVDDAVAIGAKNGLTTAYNDAASRPSNGSAGTDLAGQIFLPGVRTASTSLLLSSGSVTLDAQGDPNAVFVFQIGSTLITEANTTVSLINGAQACNVFWQVGSSATFGAGTRFVGTVMTSATITAKTGATVHGRLLAQTGAVNLDTNTITTSTCASSVSGSGGGSESSTPTETGALTSALPTTVGQAGTPSTTSAATHTAAAKARRAAIRRAAVRRRHRRAVLRLRREEEARRSVPPARGAFTG